MKNLKNATGFILTREQMKKISGGISGTCQVFIPTGTHSPASPFGGPGGTEYGSIEGSSAGITVSGLSSADAQNAVSNGGRWCCDSCGSASWAI